MNPHNRFATKTDDNTPSANETDPELSDLVESFQKLQKGALSSETTVSVPSGTTEHTLRYAAEEIDNLKRKQGTIQEQIDTKNKEIHTLRETLLVVNGALQGMQHIQNFIMDQEKCTSSLPQTSSSMTMASGKM